MPCLPSLSSLFLTITLLLLLLLHFHLSSAATPPQTPSELVDSVCKNTTDYTFCLQSLDSDTRAATADRYVLAYVAFGLAYRNATYAEHYISQLIKNGTSANGSESKRLHSLRRCKNYYNKAIMSLAEALGDLDSETFFGLDSFASDADGAVKECEAIFKGDRYKLLSPMNAGFRGLCKICVVVSKLFSVSMS